MPTSLGIQPFSQQYPMIWQFSWYPMMWRLSTIQFDGRGNIGGWRQGLKSGMYWVVVDDPFKDRKPIVIVNE